MHPLHEDFRAVGFSDLAVSALFVAYCCTVLLLRVRELFRSARRNSAPALHGYIWRLRQFGDHTPSPFSA